MILFSESFRLFFIETVLNNKDSITAEKMTEDKNIPSNIIKFPQRCDSTIIKGDVYDAFDEWGDEFFEFEDWQIDYDLLERKEYSTLLEIRKERAQKSPDNEYAQYYLGEAYIYTKEYLKGLSNLIE